MKIICTRAGCQREATILLVTESDDEQVSAYAVWAACGDHAPEEAHEAAGSMSADEYVIVRVSLVERSEAERPEYPISSQQSSCY